MLTAEDHHYFFAVDGTGFSLIKRSVYFGVVVGEIKRFIQYVAVADVESKLITAISLKKREMKTLQCFN